MPSFENTWRSWLLTVWGEMKSRSATSRLSGPRFPLSYGGQIITALGPDARNAVGLVYIAAFGLDEGESLGALLSQGPVTPALAHLFTDSRGFGWLSEDDFVNHFAADVDPTRARVMYAVQQALASSAFTDVMGAPAWESLPTWYLVAQNDEAIPPDAERMFALRMGATTVEIPSSHVAMVSHPDEVAELIGEGGRCGRSGRRPPDVHTRGAFNGDQRNASQLHRSFDPTSHRRQRDRVRLPRPR
jgi:Alpha/beta hydrolase family